MMMELKKLAPESTHARTHPAQGPELREDTPTRKGSDSFLTSFYVSTTMSNKTRSCLPPPDFHDNRCISYQIGHPKHDQPKKDAKSFHELGRCARSGRFTHYISWQSLSGIVMFIINQMQLQSCTFNFSYLHHPYMRILEQSGRISYPSLHDFMSPSIR